MTDKNIIINTPAKYFEEIKKINEQGIEYWEARELMPLLGYKNWRDFDNSINKAKIACENSMQDVNNHFEDVLKMVKIGSGALRKTKDYSYPVMLAT